MWTFSYFVGVLLAIGLLAIGMLIQYLLEERRRKNKTDWKSQFLANEAELKNSSKKFKKEQT